MPTTVAVESALAHVRDLAQAGQTELATIVAIRALGANPDAPHPDLLNDLAVLRHVADDRHGALALVRAALAIAPAHELALENLASLEASEPASAESVDASMPTGSATLNPWVRESLADADERIGLKGKRVLEVGGSVPAAAVRKLGVAHWTACDLHPDQGNAEHYTSLTANAVHLPLESASMEAAWSVCAFEHFAQPELILAEVHRVLQPGALFFAQFAPIWSCAIGHHLWLMQDGRQVVTFNDPVIPSWGHLLLERHELLAYLQLTLEPQLALRVDDFVWRHPYVNRLHEGDFKRILGASPFEVVESKYWGQWTKPQSDLRSELRRLHPQLGEPAAHGLRWLLRA